MCWWRRTEWEVAVLCCAWFALSSCSNVVGKLTLGVVPLPLSATLAQLAVAAALSAVFVPKAVGSARPSARRLLPLASAKLATSVLSHLALARLPVSLVHTLKATTPLFTAFAAFVLWRERQSRRIAASLSVLGAGVALAAVGSVEGASGDPAGLGAALGAAAALSAQHLYSKKALRSWAPHPLRLQRDLAIAALLLLAPIWLWRDSVQLYLALTSSKALEATVLLIADAILAWLQGAAALALLSRVSPLTYGVASSAKRAVVVLASLVVLRNPTPPLNVAGMSLAAIGVLAYNWAKSSPAAVKKPLLPV